MNERTKKLEAVFHAAMDLASAEERDRYLSQACAGDPELRREVDDLLKSAEAADAVFQAGREACRVPEAVPAAILTEKPGDRIGRYKLLEKIGEGGMGVVYMAEQEQPVRRKVALKIIKLGMDTRQVVARFEAERQALAMMDHPHIAQILDAGATETGRPYFVMELVQGVPITQFCDANKLSTTERLKLFSLACQAIQSAHQKGVIHRDIKPSNVLVTLNAGMPHPMVIDFGVAKATNQKLTEKTLFTNFATMIGTPAYMSPEQAEMSKLDVDTRSDIYSLGVLLYELLTGTTPFPEERLRSVAYGEMQRIIAEEEPERPSTRLKKSSRAKSGVRNLKCEVDSDLDAVVMKCLEKDRNRRYETASAFAADIQRYLQNEPVVARPPSTAYRLQKFIARRKLQFAAAMVVLMSLVAAVVVSSWQAARAARSEAKATEQARLAHTQAQVAASETQRANREAALAKAQAEAAQAVKQFLVDNLLGVKPNHTTPDLDALAYEATKSLLEKTARGIEGRFTNQPLVEADIRKALYDAFLAASYNAQAEVQAQRRLQLYQSLPEVPRTSIIDAISDVAYVRARLGHPDEALKLLDGIMEEGLRLPMLESFQQNVGQVLVAAGRAADAVPYLRKGLENRKAQLGEKHLWVKSDTSFLAQAVERAGNLGEAEEIWRQNLENCHRDHGAEHPFTGDQEWGLARCLVKQGKADLAAPMLRRVIAYAQRTMGTNSYRILDAQYWLGQTLEQTKRIEEAAELYRSLNPRIALWIPNATESALFLNRGITDFFLRHRLFADAKSSSESLRSWLEAHPPDNNDGFETFVRATAAAKGWPAAADVCRQQFERFAGTATACRTMATVFLYVGDEDGYRKATAKAFELAPTLKRWPEQQAILNIAVLGTNAFSPEQLKQCKLLIQSGEQALATATANQQNAAHRALGAMLLRLGRLTNSLEHLDHAAQKYPSGINLGRTLMLKAICLHGLKQMEEARKNFDDAEAMMKASLVDRLSESGNFLAQDERTYLIHRREAQALLGLK